jgi:hypothetical protein
MKVLVPPAPVSARMEKPIPARERFGLIEAFDAGFVGRVIASMLAVGALGMLGVLGATNSALLAISFFGGISLGTLLLWSQELFVRRVLGPRAEGEKSLWARAPLGVVLPLKYIFVGAILGIVIEQGQIAVPTLAAGFIVGQIVIVAKVVGRFAALRMRARHFE